MVANVGKDGTFPAYSCFSTTDSFRFEEINNNNKFNICIARVPYGNAHPRITIIQIKITDKFTIV